jgi:hypothetical protein
MGCGHDYDYLLPRGALVRFFHETAQIWPDWVAELRGGVSWFDAVSLSIGCRRRLATDLCCTGTSRCVTAITL